MKAAGKGHIVNITSTFEREWMSGMAVYCGSKHFWTGENILIGQCTQIVSNFNKRKYTGWTAILATPLFSYVPKWIQNNYELATLSNNSVENLPH